MGSFCRKSNVAIRVYAEALPLFVQSIWSGSHSQHGKVARDYPGQTVQRTQGF